MGKLYARKEFMLQHALKNALDMMEGHMALQNAWKKTNYEWFIE